jgi:6-phosphogluconolactonase (cycloisomerase 2 family)
MVTRIGVWAISALFTLATAVAAQPRLSLTQELIDGKSGITTLEGARSVAVSSTDGAFVHVAASGDNDHALTTFSRSLATGHLTLVEAEVEGADSVTGLTNAEVVGVTPDGAHIYVGGVDIVVFSRNGLTGATTYEETLPYDDRMSGMAISPGGEHVYVTSDLPNPDAQLAVYERDGGTGTLTLVQQISDDEGGVDGIDRATCVAVSPDGAHVYVGGSFDNAVAAFERDLVTGELTFLQQYVNGSGGITGLFRPRAIVVSPDGAQVYVGGNQGLVQFDRNAGTGLLTFVEHAQVDASVVSLAVSADGTRLAAANTAADPDRVALISRDTGSGTLTEASEETLDDVRAVAISPDGAHIYAVAPKSVGVFRVVTTACNPTPLPGCLLPTLSQKAVLQLKDSPDDEADKLTAKWLKGAAFAIGDFGDPIDQPDDVVTCIYDASADPQPVLEALVPGGGSCRGKPCWKTNSSGTTLKYKDSFLFPDGIATLTAKGGAAGLTSVKVKGKRSPLPMPTLPLTPPVRLQIQASTGTCWEAVFSTPITNDALQFKAKGD